MAYRLRLGGAMHQGTATDDTTSEPAESPALGRNNGTTSELHEVHEDHTESR